MSIADTIEEAQTLHKAGHKEGALRLLLIAVAATAQKRYPRKRYKDRVAFEAFVLDEILAGNFFGPRTCVGVSMPWQGQSTPIETILYDLRCNLIHEATMHNHVLRDLQQDPTQLVIRINADGKFVFQDSFLVCLFKSLHNVSENMGELTPIPFTKTPGGRAVAAKREYRITTRCLRLPLP